MQIAPGLRFHREIHTDLKKHMIFIICTKIFYLPLFTTRPGKTDIVFNRAIKRDPTYVPTNWGKVNTFSIFYFLFSSGR